MRRVIIESPYGGTPEIVERNVAYARRAMLDSLRRGEAPFASHLIYTQVLDDSVADDRKLGMSAGFAWVEVAQKTAVYTDLGISSGMQRGIEVAEKNGLPVEYREIGVD